MTPISRSCNTSSAAQAPCGPAAPRGLQLLPTAVCLAASLLAIGAAGNASAALPLATLPATLPAAPVAAVPPQAAASRPTPTPVKRWVALDVGHRPGEGTRSASGLPEHNFNLAFAAEVERQLGRQGVIARRLPTGLSLADRVQRAQGAMLALSVHHDSARRMVTGQVKAKADARPVALQAAAAAAAGNVPGSGYTLTVGQAGALACAQGVARQLQSTGRHFAAEPGVAWADKSLGVRRHGQGALLEQAWMPVLKLSVADIANPTEERLAAQPAWVVRQAAAVARGVAQCLDRSIVAPGASRPIAGT